MFIFKDTQKRGPAYPQSTPYTAPDGSRHLSYPMDLLEEIAEPAAPDDYSDTLYFRTEQDDAPYVIYTRKPDDMIAKAENAKRLAKIAELEDQQRRELARYDRESKLAEAEAAALSAYGLDAAQLYAAGMAPDAPIAARNYVRLKDIDNAIKAEREALQVVVEQEVLP